MDRIGDISGHAERDARSLVDWALIQGMNLQPDRAGYSVLAELIEPVLKTVGEDGQFLISLIIDKPLIVGDAIEQFRRRRDLGLNQ